MKGLWIFPVVILGSFAIGAWLVIQNHPGFALLIILCGACVEVKDWKR